MILTLAHLQWMTLRGRVIRSIRLLKQPKYLVGAVVAAGWMMLWVGRPLLQANVGGKFMRIANAERMAQDLMPAIHLFASVGFTLIFLLPWLFPWGKLGLGFREAELTMLLQAPLTRRQIIGYGLLKSGIGSTITALVFTVILGNGGPADLLRTFPALMLIFVFWDLNSKWRGLFLLRQREVPSRVAWTRRVLVTTGLLAYLALLVAVVVRFQLSLFSRLGGADFEAVSSNIERLAQEIGSAPLPDLLAWLVKPGWIITAPLFTGSWMAFVVATLPVLALVVLQRELVLRHTAHFEESALEHAQSEETKKSPTRRFKKLSSRARDRSPFSLPSVGRPEVAILWKNLMRATRIPLRQILLGGAISAALIASIPVVFRLIEVPYFIMLLCGGVMMVFPAVIVGMAWNNDMRTEFGHIEILRTWPISAEKFVLAQVASPAVSSFLTALVGTTLVLAAFLGSRLLELRTGIPSSIQLTGTDASGIGPGLALAFVLAGVLPLSAGAAFASSAMQNLAVLFVPAWMAESGTGAKGIAAFGRRLVFAMGVFLAFTLALIPSAVLVGGAVLLQHLAGIPWSVIAVPVWGTLAAAPLFVGGWLVVRLAARLWRDLDPSEEVLEIGA